MEFDPDKYLEEKDQEFDPDQYLAESAKESAVPSFGEDVIDVGLSTLGAVGSVLDYPYGIARGAAKSILDLSGKEVPEQTAQETMSRAIMGDAPTSQELAQKIGIPDDPIPFTNIPQSAAAGFGLDILSGVPENLIASKLGGKLSRGARWALDSDQRALEAVETSSKEGKRMVQETAGRLGEDPLAKVKERTKYIKGNIVNKAFDTTEDLLLKARKKLDDVGSSIGVIRKSNERAVDEWLSKSMNQKFSVYDYFKPDVSRNVETPSYLQQTFKLTDRSNPEAMQYLGGMFNVVRPVPKIAGELVVSPTEKKIIQNIRERLEDPEDAAKAMEIIIGKFDSLEDKYKTFIDVDKLTKLKKQWAEKVGYDKKAMALTKPVEVAYDELQRAADDAIENEIYFADKYLKGKDLQKHQALKKEYGILKKIIPNVEVKLGREAVGKGPQTSLIKPWSWGQNTRMQSAIANIPESISPTAKPLMFLQGAKLIGSGANMREGREKEMSYYGYPASQTIQVSPAEMLTYGKDLESAQMDNVEKAKRMQLLNKYKRVYIGE